MFKKLLKISFILALIVVILGAYTRLEDAGLGCPDWPGCYGHFIVPEVAHEDYQQTIEPAKAWKEMIHRYSASVLGLLILGLFFVAFKNRKNPVHQSAKLPGLLALIVIFQGLLGMWTVTELVHPGIVSMHLVGGFSTVGLLLWLILNQNKTLAPRQNILKRHKYLLFTALIFLGAQIVLGGWVSTNYAALSCGEQFPMCLGSWWPAMDFANAFHWGALGINYEYGVLENPARTAIQMIHRIGALVVTLLLAVLLFALRRYNLKSHLRWVGGLLSVQIALGVFNVLFSLPLSVAVLHNLVALLLMLSLVALTHQVFRVSKRVS